MKNSFKAVRLTDRVYWVGAIDWELRDFHGYATERGSSYNAYLIMADKITLVDTVKAPFKQEMISRIESVAPLKKIDYIISNHAEMDHSGLLPEMVKITEPEKVFASPRGLEAIKNHFHDDLGITVARDGENISLGNMNIRIIETAMLHWPDSMMTYLAEEKVLFSQDGFGMHLASGKRWADEIENSILRFEAAKYFANILLPYSKLILSLADKLKKLGFPVNILAPDHGPCWRRDINIILNWYENWALQKPGKKAVVVYDTMWKSTEIMARTIADGIISTGAETQVMPLKSCSRSNVATELLEAGVLLAGSPTLNDNLFPTVADCLTYLKGLKRQNLTGAAFGSFGWNGKAVDQINDYFKAMNISLSDEGLRVKYVPDSEALSRCIELGVRIGQKLA